MRLYTTATSPYGRVVRVLLAECGLADRVEVRIVRTRVADCPVNAFNPTGKVPTLETDDGHYLSEARLIGQYLDTLHDGPALVDGNPGIEARELEGILTGFVDGLAVWLRELKRPPHERSPGILAQERARAERCLDYLEAHPRWLTDEADYLRITLAVNLALLDQGLEHAGWSHARPRLLAWYRRFAERPSMRATDPYR